MKGVILAGGTGSRLNPITKVTNKHLLPVYNEPMIFKPLKTLRNSGIKDIVIVLGGESVGDFVKLLGSGKDFNVNLSYVYQDRAGGIAEALSLTRDFVKDSKVAVILGDNIFEDSFSEEVKSFENEEKYGCYLFLKEVPDPCRFGVAELGDNNRILNIIEKPEQPKSNYAVTGLYFYDEMVFNYIDKVMASIGYSKRGELEITDVNNIYVKQKIAKAVILDNFWSDAGTFKTLLKSSNFLESQTK
ncbi:MAG: sugar phosphate nucleotidyltransferase [Promethearchaeota archaeon]